MSSAENQTANAPSPVAPAPAPRAQGWSCLPVAFGLSVLLNLGFLVLVLVGCIGFFFFGGFGPSEDQLEERLYSGNQKAKNKIAIVQIEGVIMEGFLGYYHKQIQTAARDKDVKAVVLRVNSPGGTITGSDDLYRRLIDLRDGTGRSQGPSRPLVVSMGALAASGGYYISMPARDKVYAERTTMTGSIGVYAAFPNIKELGDKIGFHMEVVKSGDVKEAGSPFKTMTPEERAIWHDLVADAYRQFIEVIEENRPSLKGKMKEAVIKEERTDRDPEGKPIKFEYKRLRADGGVFTATQAKKFGLIDAVGTLDDAIQEAARLADLGDDYKAVKYDRPRTLVESMLGLHGPSELPLFGVEQLSSGLTPRLWYLSPQSELAGLAATLRRKP